MTKKKASRKKDDGGKRLRIKTDTERQVEIERDRQTDSQIADFLLLFLVNTQSLNICYIIPNKMSV